MGIGSSNAFFVKQQNRDNLGFRCRKNQKRFLPSRLLSHGSNFTIATVAEDNIIDNSVFIEAMSEQLKEFKEFNDAQTRSSPVYSLQSNTREKDEEIANNLFRARILLLCAAALYGTNFSLVKLMGSTMPVGVSLPARFGLASLFTFPWLVEDLCQDTTALASTWLGFEVGLWNSIGYISQAVGLETTAASKSAFICSLAVVVVPLLDFAAGKILHSRQLIGAFLAVVGVGFLELGGDLSMQTITSGDVLSLIQPFAFGIGFWKMEHAMQKYPSQACRMTAAQLLAVFVASIAFAYHTIDPTMLQSFPLESWLKDSNLFISICWTGIVTTALTIYMENIALETLSAAETTVIFSTEPIWGTSFAAVVMGEQLGFNAAIGAVCILVACIYSNIDGFLPIFEKLNDKKDYFLKEHVIASPGVHGTTENENEVEEIDISINLCDMKKR